VDGKRDETEISEQSVAILQHVALLQTLLAFFAGLIKLIAFTDHLLTVENIRHRICCKITTPIINP